MKIYPTVRAAWKALRRNPMRAMLTTLGVVIGVGAVIAMMEIGEGSSAAIRERISSMGANALVVIPSTAETGSVTYGAGSAMTLTPEDCEAILRNCPSIRDAAPIVRARAQVIHGNRNWVPESIEGTTKAYLEVREWSIAEGRVFSEHEAAGAGRVCLLGQTLVGKLFEESTPVIGKEVRLMNVSLRVIGVLAEKGANLMGQDQDDVLLAPWTTIKYHISGSRLESTNQSTGISGSDLYPGEESLYPEKSATQTKNTPMLVRFPNIDAIMTAARSTDKIPDAIEEITEVLRVRHDIGTDDPDDFEIIDLTEIVSTLSATTMLMTNLLLGVAAISLAVGGVGIMNIMLVSVTERTREIGLRMAVGARSRDILRQFLIEAIMLCLVGGVIGILFGNGVSYLIWRFFQWPVEATPIVAVVAVLVSAGVGIIFGFYPAWKASRLDPIDAIRYE